MNAARDTSAFELSRVLTTGGSGMIGSYVDFGDRPGEDELNILDTASIERTFARVRPATVIHLAGATDMARCESDPDYAFRLNAVGTYHMARAAQRAGAVFVYVSTSRVFGGDKDDAYVEADVPDPHGAYAESKHMGELIVQALVPGHLIVRTAWVFGGGPSRDTKFYGKVIRQLLDGKTVRALDDVRGSPTYGKDLVVALVTLLTEGRRGLFHVANGESATRYDIARSIAEYLGRPETAERARRGDFPGTDTLPANESIVSTINLRPWRAALAEYLEVAWGLPHIERRIA